MFIFEPDAHFRSCHASTVVSMPDGDAVVAWFAGTKEGADDVDIWLAIRHDGKWSEPRIVAAADGTPLWNPVLCRHNQRLLLFYRIAGEISKWKSEMKESVDGGRTWSDAQPLPEGFLGPIKNKPIRMSDGLWLCGSSVETPDRWYCRMELFDAETGTWPAAADLHLPDVAKGIIQPAVWESSPGCVHALMRSTIGRVVRSDSADAGRSWSVPRVTDLPNNNSGLDVARLADGSLVVCLNPVPENWGKRTPLVLWRSFDNGLTWPDEVVLEDEPGEYSYPAVVPHGDGVAVTYTHKRKTVCYRVVSGTEFRAQA